MMPVWSVLIQGQQNYVEGSREQISKASRHHVRDELAKGTPPGQIEFVYHEITIRGIPTTGPNANRVRRL